MGIKVLMLGLRAAGKTTIIKHTLEGKEYKELVNIPATEGIETPSYHYRGLIEVNVFDCGGQTQFLDNYYTDSMIGTIFGGKTRILFWIVDSSTPSLLAESRKEFIKAFNAVREYSAIYPLVYVLVHKYDEHEVLKKDVESYFNELDEIKGVHFYTSSVVSGTARKIVGRLLDEIVKKEAEGRINSLKNLLKKYNTRVNANLSTLINSDDGLEIASDFRNKFDDELEVLEFLQYLSVKVMSDSLDKASEIFNRFKTHNFISNSEYNMVAFRLREEYMLFFKLHEKVSFLTIVPVNEATIDKCVREINKISKGILEILKL
jgi:GTPase SAR1 family protein